MEKRVEILNEYELLDTLPESEFDDIVELASAFFHAPISLITLLDSHRQWFKAKIGIDGEETPLEHAFCYHAIQRPEEVMIVPDSLQDDRFKNNPFTTGAPHVRFYAGAPLVTDEGYALGTLCVIDAEPRTFSPEETRILKILADKVIERFETRKHNITIRKEVEAANARVESALNRLLEAEKIAGIGNWDIISRTNEIYWSPEMYRIYGVKEDDRDPMTFQKWQRMIHPDDVALFSRSRRGAIVKGEPVVLEYRIIRAGGEERWLYSTIESNENGHVVGTTLDITARKKSEESRRQYTAALEQMLFALSHKVRKPAANVLGIVNTLKKDNVSNADVQECLPYLKSAADDLDGYIRELNDFISKHKAQISDGADTASLR